MSRVYNEMGLFRFIVYMFSYSFNTARLKEMHEYLYNVPRKLGDKIQVQGLLVKRGNEFFHPTFVVTEVSNSSQTYPLYKVSIEAIEEGPYYYLGLTHYYKRGYVSESNKIENKERLKTLDVHNGIIQTDVPFLRKTDTTQETIDKHLISRSLLWPDLDDNLINRQNGP